jgi:hypothetical protein
LQAFKRLSLKYGADLQYKSEVKSVNHEDKVVQLADGTTFRAKHNIVIAAGVFS